MNFESGLQPGFGIIDIFLLIVISLAAYFDLREGRIPNKITSSAVAIGLIYRFVAGGAPELYDALLGGAIGFGILLIPFILRGMGAGDVKLLMAIGVLKGVEFVFYTALAMGVIGGIIAVYYYFFVKLRGAYFPYGVAISIGAVIALGIL